MSRKSEQHRVFEETSFAENQTSLGLDDFGEDKSEKKKDHRFSVNIGAFNDGLRSSFSKQYSLYS